MKDKQEWIPCSERPPTEDNDAIVACWVAVCGFESEFPGGDLEYFSAVVKGEFFRGRWVSPRLSDHGEHIRAWMPYYAPAPYIEPRKVCKLCCGEKTLGKGKDKMICWRCGGRGDEAADGSDAVSPIPAEVKKELERRAKKPQPEAMYDIWSEGYACTGNSSGATLHGRHRGSSFKEACIAFAETSADFKKYFDPKNMKYWGCSLFDNHHDAVQAFG